MMHSLDDRNSPISRRGWLGGLASAAIGSVIASKVGAAPGRAAGRGTVQYAYVGARTTRSAGARGEGIAVFRVGDGQWTQIQLVPDMQNPAFMCFDAAVQNLYSVRGDAHELRAYRRDANTGLLSILNSQSIGGRSPVHVTIDHTNRFLVTANYAASLAVLPRLADGSLGPVSQLVPTTGPTGPHKVEQDHSKPHQAQFDPSGRWLASPDKGCDVVRVYAFDAGAGTLTLASTATAPEGAGCRHIVFHPTRPFAYLVNELNSTVIAFRFDNQKGTLTPFQQLSSLPDSFVGFSRASTIEMLRGRFLYVSNRGSDTIGAYAIDQKTGRLTAFGWQGTGGTIPRYAVLGPDGALYAGNQGTDTITRLAIDQHKGVLAAATVATPSPTPSCILFAPAA
jgi:6-phosphogluconolactonase